MHYVQFGSDISPNYIMPAEHIFAYTCICIVVCRILDSEYVAIAVESVEMGGGGLTE